MNKNQIIGVVGVCAIVIGCFAPLVSLPFASINYLAGGRGDGIFLLIVTALSGYFVAVENYDRLRICAVVSTALCLFTFVNFSTRLAEMHASMDSQLRGNPFKGIADAMVSAVGFGWGWSFLIIGLACLFVSAGIPRFRVPIFREKQTEPADDSWVQRAMSEVDSVASEQRPNRIARSSIDEKRSNFGKRGSS